MNNMKKRKIISTVFASIIAMSIFISCGKEDERIDLAESEAINIDDEIEKQENKIEEKVIVNDNDVVEEEEETVVNNDINNEITDSIISLSNIASGWGPGVNFDSNNRPTGATYYQELYGKYDADFIKSDDKKIYLTFDEGYENGYTSQILDILKAKNVKAVFFVTEPYAKSQNELIKRIIDEGHIVGSHSVTHPSGGMPSLSIEAQKAEMVQLHKYIKETFDYDMCLFRYPAGIFSEQSLALMQNLGYRSVFWSFAYADWDPNNQPEESGALQKLTERLHGGAIYLLHAVSKTNTDILGDFIDNARNSGYEFAKYI